MTRVDLWMIVILTPLFGVGLAMGAVHGVEGPAARAEARRFTAGGDVPTTPYGTSRAPAGTSPDGSPQAGNPFTPPPPLAPGMSPLANVKVTAAEGTTFTHWDLLKTYEYQPELAGMPEDVKALDGKRVTMAGFLLPLYEFEDIHEFALVGNHWSCCFGQPPTLNGVVSVTLAKGETGIPNTAEPLRVVGTFRVKETKESGYVVSIFSIDDAKVSIIPY